LIFCHCKRPLVAHASILPQKMGARGLLQRCPKLKESTKAPLSEEAAHQLEIIFNK
jgi:hypothetical protein